MMTVISYSFQNIVKQSLSKWTRKKLTSEMQLMCLECTVTFLKTKFSYCYYLQTFAGQAGIQTRSPVTDLPNGSEIMLLFMSVQSVPLTYLPDLAVSKGLSTSQAALLISIVGITNIFGRIISGLVTDLLKIKSSVTYTITLFTASLVNFTVPWCDDFVKLAVCGALFGLCMATAVSMRTIVLADHLGIEKLTKAFGMIALFQGIAFMTNAPLAGFLYETSKSYVMPFCFAGGMYFLSATFCLIMLCLDRRPDTKTIEIVVDVK